MRNNGNYLSLDVLKICCHYFDIMGLYETINEGSMSGVNVGGRVMVCHAERGNSRVWDLFLDLL